MPNYIDLSDIETAFSESELTELSTDGSEVLKDDTLINKTIDQSESLIDTYLSAQVAVPLSNPSAFIKGAVVSLVKYYLFYRRHHVPEAVQLEYERLFSCKKGEEGIIVKMSMGLLPIDPSQQTGLSSVAYGSEPRAFDNNLTGVQ